VAGLLRSVLESAGMEPPKSHLSSTPSQDLTPARTKIVVAGVGGAGNNTVNRLASIGVTGAEIVAVNTDKMHLDTVKAAHKILVGYEITKGFGAGGSLEIGRRAVAEAEDKFREIFADSDLVFVTCGMGGGTGTGGAPIVARIAKEQGALVMGVVTIPFRMEKGRVEKATEGLRELRENVDSTVVIDNNRLLGLAPGVPMSYAFSMADEVLAHMVKGITEAIMLPSLINLDFADVRAVMESGNVVMVGVGESDAKDRARRAIEQAFSCPLLGNVDYSTAGGVLMQICGGPDVTLAEANQIGELIRARVSPDAQVIWGARIDPSLGNALRAILLVSGARSPHLLGPASDGGVYTHGTPSSDGLGSPINLKIDYL
jgi:cell division protein FtsZ